MNLRISSYFSARNGIAGILVVGLTVALAGCGGNSNNTATTTAPTTYPAPTGGNGSMMAHNKGMASNGTKMASASGRATTGEGIFTQDCGRCHKIGSVGAGRIALDHIGKNRDKSWLTVQIRTPQAHHSRMPAFPPDRLSDKDLNTLLAYLVKQK